MKNLNYLVPIFILLSFTSCKVELFDCLQGEGEVETRLVELSKISALEIEFPVNIILTEGDSQIIEITAQPNVIDELVKDSEMNGEKWTIEIKGCTDVDEVDIFMTLETIKDISIDAVADIRTEGVFNNIEDLKIEVDGVGEFKLELGTFNLLDIDVDGACEFNVSGTTTEQKINIDGAGEINNTALKSTNTAIDIDGTGNCSIWAENNLNADLNGAGSLCIKGTPTRNIDISGAFDILDCN